MKWLVDGWNVARVMEGKWSEVPCVVGGAAIGSTATSTFPVSNVAPSASGSSLILLMTASILLWTGAMDLDAMAKARIPKISLGADPLRLSRGGVLSVQFSLPATLENLSR